ncbi:MAG: hypothetical protein A2Z91_00145 [Deltaproteobacteria bacterium GWA2_38_16]|nr:MAG: hypothetical protein A2Z91_00145 [Deltaproteobacteria bacterium GWA2_38_16]OGQ03516.1 MAG: hypothetical protein A3D19_01550 [Deltaproteobacteria bacterium RIFCSPHIGHO2_02_FULL_38_15]OGQ30392.1 MAG: hypothetical protein A3A72_01775 [Deltaproteobacteria bacterium RIFCSPLOWO2_01_FULL_38_9]OGQ61477.1 MAG: hypothetical protein A3G92_03530 [Deltaproteobacteria bacterium RIFCSPLOWO2_12_FULL_38_8]
MKKIMFLMMSLSFIPFHSFAQKVEGKDVFNTKCAACHSYGQGDRIGPDLKGITQRRKADWIKKMIKSPDTMLKSDATAKELLKKYNNIPMTNLGLKDAEVNAVMSYLKDEDAKK